MTYTSVKIPDSDGHYSVIEDATGKVIGEVRKVYSTRTQFGWIADPIQFPVRESVTTRRTYSQKRTATDALKGYYKSEGVRCSLIY